MPYGNDPPPEGAPVPPQELIGASIVIGLVSVLSISIHGYYLIGLALGHVSFDGVALGLIVLNVVGFAGSLWLLALRRWAWAMCLAYAAIEVGLRLTYTLNDVVPGVFGHGQVSLLGGAGQLALALVFLVLLGFLSGAETRALLDAREAYRRQDPDTTTA